LQKERQSRLDKYHQKMVGPASLWPVWRAALPQGPEIASAALGRLRLWASLLDPDFKHAEHLAQLALQLYDGLPGKASVADWKGQDERSLLRMAALLHDVGRAKGEKSHHKRTFRLVTRMTPPLGWSERELRLAGAIARYHRGALPRAGQKTLAGLTPTERKIALRLAGILRLAEAFDSNHDRRINRVAVHEHNGYLQIAAEGYSPRDDMAETIAGARHLLETIYRRPILVKPLTFPSLKLVS
jgi:exopolyphosphatase/guanosine-5'-triphosphate,3'-diphosphate pyrophosphatase